MSAKVRFIVKRFSRVYMQYGIEKVLMEYNMVLNKDEKLALEIKGNLDENVRVALEKELSKAE